MQKAFSLVELSIVLVILGLLTGGILAGQSLIHAAELRSVTRDAGNYLAAMTTFREKYFALPGDMPNAVKYWGAQAGGTADGIDATCAALLTAATDTSTCNGDGDGYITDIAGNQMQEAYRVWQQLANAGMIAGSFTGVSGLGAAGNPVVGVNIPASKIAQTGFQLRAYATRTSADPTYFAGDYGNVMWFGIPLLGSGSLRSASIKPEDAWNIDKKIDDGKPGYGTWVAPKVLGTCFTSTDPTISEYAVTYSDIACAFMIKMGN